MTYQERYCAFVDILGFKQLIKELRNNAAAFESLRDVLSKMHTPHDPNLFGTGQSDFRAQRISDAVAFSTLPTPEGLRVLLGKLKALSLALLHKGVFTRGAICKGLLHHDEHMVFGDSLIRAYSLESAIVKFPRIMIANEVVSDAFASESGLTVDDLQHFLKAEDGPTFLHVLWSVGMVLGTYKNAPEHRGSEHILRFYSEMATAIRGKLDEAVDTPAHFEKVKWFANYWNETVDSVGGSIVMHIDGPGLKWHLPPHADNHLKC